MFSELIHYSSNPLKFDKTRIYVQDNVWNKPNGLWLSHNKKNGWRYVCVRDNIRKGNLRHKTYIELLPSSRILTLKTIDDINEFINTYYYFDNLSYRILDDGAYFIDWNRVALDYDGICISHYNSEHKLEFKKTHLSFLSPTLWYDTLSCDCLCVWNLNCILSISSSKTHS